MRIHALTLFALFLLGTAAAAETVTIEAGRDATLIEDPNGTLANGSGPFFFAGRTSQAVGGVRRGLLYFDVAAALPDRALVESATLTLYVSTRNPQTHEVRLHRVLADWGEGPSAAAGGGGATAEPGDATWLHGFYDYEFWVHNGGQFVGRPSARADVGDSGFYVWQGQSLAHDVRRWLAAPQRNFGWIVIGDETTPQTAKSYASREHDEIALRPLLEVTYRLPGERPRQAPSGSTGAPRRVP